MGEVVHPQRSNVKDMPKGEGKNSTIGAKGEFSPQPSPAPWLPDDLPGWIEVPDTLMTCPVEPGVRVEILFRTERECRVYNRVERLAGAAQWDWYAEYPAHIVAYRVVEPKAEPTPEPSPDRNDVPGLGEGFSSVAKSERHSIVAPELGEPERLSRRDRFAMAAPPFSSDGLTAQAAAFFMGQPCPQNGTIGEQTAYWIEAEARYRFAYADAMLKAGGRS